MVDFGDDSEGFERAEAARRPSIAPTAPPRRPSFAPTAPAPGSLRRSAPDSEGPPSADFDGEDFLFHLYRGSELLQDNCVSEAKEELERALRVQPQDIEGQGLLGVVYFRLGLYPRAIEIYREIIRVCPGEVSPRVNLALCFLKTGQSQLARENLEEVTLRVPDHVRAWGYLGLVYERLGAYESARSAFERAGQPHLVQRMRQLLDDQTVRDADGELPPELAEVQDSRPSAPRSRRLSLMGRWGPAVPPILEPAELDRSSIAPGARADLPQALRDADPSSEPPVVVPSRRSALIDVEASWSVRSDAVRGLLAHGPAFSTTPLARRMRGRELEEPLGGPGSPWVQLTGTGQILVGAAPERELSALELDDTFVYVRESCLVAFAGGARHENGRLSSGGGEPISMVHISGRGTVLIESRKPPRVLAITENQKLAVRADDIVGWIGRLLGHPLEPESAPLQTPGFVAFSGSGSVLVDIG